MIVARIYKIFNRFMVKARILHFRLISDSKHRNCFKTICVLQPLLLKGKGSIRIGEKVTLGVNPSPGLYSGYHHIEARHSGAEVIFGNNIVVNNNATIIADITKITINDDTVIGNNLQIFDSDFHNLDPQKRLSTEYAYGEVIIGRNVFIGSYVTILKGVSIGENSVIGSGSVVVKSIPANVVAAGNPCRVLKQL